LSERISKINNLNQRVDRVNNIVKSFESIPQALTIKSSKFYPEQELKEFFYKSLFYDSLNNTNMKNTLIKGNDLNNIYLNPNNTGEKINVNLCSLI
jgi:hypothetical protein